MISSLRPGGLGELFGISFADYMPKPSLGASYLALLACYVVRLLNSSPVRRTTKAVRPDNTSGVGPLVRRGNAPE